ncbi:MAG: hypothetical protein QM757_25690 [Paludibaculum sp.]
MPQKLRFLSARVKSPLASRRRPIVCTQDEVDLTIPFGRVSQRRYDHFVAKLFAAILTLATIHAGLGASRETDPIECAEIQPGSSVERKTDTVHSPDGKSLAFAVVTLTRGAEDSSGEKCRVGYRLLVQEGTATAKAVKAFDEVRSEIVGVTIVGYSQDGSNVAGDFWWAEGDYTAVRPVVYSFKTRKAAMRDLGDRITRRLPSCDYFESFERITNRGDAIIHVPKSHYVETGCPDQGEWAFNLTTGRVRRLAAVRQP